MEAEAGARMLEAGGSAVDAVVAAAFTGFVVEPAMCGLGGYGHLAAYLADSGEFLTVDHCPRAPRAAHAHMFELDEAAPTLHYGWPRVAGRRNEWGCLAAAVPGAVAGLCAAHERAGRLPLAQVLEPAVEAAEAGVEVSWSLLLIIADGRGPVNDFSPIWIGRGIQLLRLIESYPCYPFFSVSLI
jgi:gamma-glutamyltranspeptidase/glutathione hydrolase